jgi:hypothetical protein
MVLPQHSIYDNEPDSSVTADEWSPSPTPPFTTFAHFTSSNCSSVVLVISYRS